MRPSFIRHGWAFALLVSGLLHLFVIGTFRVYIKPAIPNKGVTSEVFFLGSILEEEPIGDRGLSGSPASDAQIGYAAAAEIPEFLVIENAKAEAVEKPVFAVDFDVIIKEMYLKLAQAGRLTGTKQIPLRDVDKVEIISKAFSSQMKGPVRFRDVIYKPELPAYLRWDEELGVDLDRLGGSFEMELKFWVSPEGRVEFVERLSSSGHPAIDLMGIRYLKGWQFAPAVDKALPLIGIGKAYPVDKTFPSEDRKVYPVDKQWGIVTLDFSLKKAEAR